MHISLSVYVHHEERGLQIFPRYPACYVTAWVVGQSRPVQQCDGASTTVIENEIPQFQLAKPCP